MDTAPRSRAGSRLKRRRRAGSAESVESGGGGIAASARTRKPRPSDVPPSGAALLVALAARESSCPRGIRSSTGLPASELARAALLAAALNSGANALRSAAARGKPARILTSADAPPTRAPPLGDVCALAAAAMPALPSARGAGAVVFYGGAAQGSVAVELNSRVCAAIERVRQLRVQCGAADGNLGWGSWGRGLGESNTAAVNTTADTNTAASLVLPPSTSFLGLGLISEQNTAASTTAIIATTSCSSDHHLAETSTATTNTTVNIATAAAPVTTTHFDDSTTTATAAAVGSTEMFKRGYTVISLTSPQPIAAATILAASVATEESNGGGGGGGGGGTIAEANTTQLGWQADVDLPISNAALQILEGLLISI
jgi:hypothetical protein